MMEKSRSPILVLGRKYDWGKYGISKYWSEEMTTDRKWSSGLHPSSVLLYLFPLLRSFLCSPVEVTGATFGFWWTGRDVLRRKASRRVHSAMYGRQPGERQSLRLHVKRDVGHLLDLSWERAATTTVANLPVKVMSLVCMTLNTGC